MLTQLVNHVSEEQCSTGEYTKKEGPRWGKFIDRRLSGAFNEVGAWTGAGAGVKKRRPCRFRGPGGPVTNTIGS